LKDLETLLERGGDVVQGSALNFGKWDVAIGLRKTIYLRNPNTYAKANLTHLKHKDARVKIDLPDTIGPLDTEPVDIVIPPQKFKTESAEAAFFQDVLDSIAGNIIWEKP